jgi:hypothetical protein
MSQLQIKMPGNMPDDLPDAAWLHLCYYKHNTYSCFFLNLFTPSSSLRDFKQNRRGRRAKAKKPLDAYA